MNRAAISLQEYEAAERELAQKRAQRFWLRHASLFAVVAAMFAIVEVRANGGIWWPYLLVASWALVLFAHYRWSIRNGDVHVREQQIRAEWRAARSKEQLIPR